MRGFVVSLAKFFHYKTFLGPQGPTVTPTTPVMLLPSLPRPIKSLFDTITPLPPTYSLILILIFIKKSSVIVPLSPCQPRHSCHPCHPCHWTHKSHIDVNETQFGGKWAVENLGNIQIHDGVWLPRTSSTIRWVLWLVNDWWLEPRQLGNDLDHWGHSCRVTHTKLNRNLVDNYFSIKPFMKEENPGFH